MKRILLFIAFTSVTIALHPQLPFKSTSILEPEEEIIGHTWYDLQTNNSTQNRIYYYEDGTIGAVWTQSFDPYTFPDRGTGYNYFDGESWDDWPTERIESDRTGWPSYAPLGNSGEIIVSHISWPGIDSGLIISKRDYKGSGDWSESHLYGPPGHESIYWPRMITGGPGNNYIYILAITEPTVYGGNLYQGLDGALIYSRSTDEGNSWDILNQVLLGMDSTENHEFVSDCYAFADPKNEIVAFVVGSYAHDLFLMKSTDFGETFEKTIIWDHPYNELYPTFSTDTFYCVDGSIDVDLDIFGNAHVAFGIIKTYFDLNYGYWRFFKDVDGIGYWNEDMESFSSDKNALNPYGHPDSELIPDYNLIAWAQDMNGDSIVNLLGYFGYRNYGISSMVQLGIDDLNRVFLFYTSVTETYDNGYENYRHLWCRSSPDGGLTWGDFYNLTTYDPIHIFDECSYPSIAKPTDEEIYLTYLTDNEPGILNYNQENAEQMFVRTMKINKDEIVGVKKNISSDNTIEVSQNFPNPFSDKSYVNVNLQKKTDLKLEIFSLLGQKVYETNMINAKQGLNSITIEANKLFPGVYFYTVKAENISITKKMIVE